MSGEDQSADELLDQAESQIAQALAADDEVVEASDGDEEVVDESGDDEEAQEDDEQASESESDGISEEDQARIAEARAQGWRPKDEYKGDPKRWKDYDEFLAVGDRISSKLNSKIDYLTERNEKLDAMIRQLVKAQGEVTKQAQQDALARLKAQRREAIEIGDVDTVDDLDEQIETVKSKKVETVGDEPPQPKIDPEVHDWIEAEKSWFHQGNPDMVQFASTIDATERQLDPHADSGVILGRVKEAVAQRFPGRVPSSKPKQRAKGKQLKHSPVEAGTTPVKSDVRLSDLPAEAQKIAAQFERDGVMTKKEYLQMFKEGMA